MKSSNLKRMSLSSTILNNPCKSREIFFSAYFFPQPPISQSRLAKSFVGQASRTSSRLWRDEVLHKINAYSPLPLRLCYNLVLRNNCTLYCSGRIYPTLYVVCDESHRYIVTQSPCGRRLGRGVKMCNQRRINEI